MARLVAASFALAAVFAAAEAEAAPLANGSAGAAHTYAGAFAIPGQTTRSTATLTVVPRGPLAASIDLSETDGTAPIHDYDVEMTKRLHLIVVSDDFSTFAHLHPDLKSDGHFSLDVDVPKPGRYYIYADAEPHGSPKSVFRFAVPFGTAPQRSPLLVASGKTVVTEPYAVSLDTLSLHASVPTSILVKIAKDRKPAPDLTPYLGGAAHAVFIDGATLSYLHVHPSSGVHDAMASMSGMRDMPATSHEMADLPEGSNVPPTMRLHLGAVPAGRYKLWLQFRGGNLLHVASFVLTSH